MFFPDGGDPATPPLPPVKNNFRRENFYSRRHNLFIAAAESAAVSGGRTKRARDI